ncbi:cytochrome P450 [Kitasatospora sp. NPDC094019]|uniref:cytochrome P450 n=1 Tax=Kitasatospora sp. NPDC094019 TaxID=3364091 RepID=UPI00381C3380
MRPASTTPIVPGALPVLGHAPALARDPYGFISGLPVHGDLVRIRLGPQDAYVACHPDLTRRVLADDRTFDKGGPFFDKIRQVIGDGLASCPAGAHRRQRHMLQPAFHRDAMPGYAATMAEEIAGATAHWRTGDVVEVPAAMCRITTAVTARCLFAAHERAGALPVHACMDQVTKGIAARVLLPVPGLDRLPTPGNRRFRRAQADLRRLTRLLITDYRAEGADHHDLLSTLLAARDDDGQALSDDEIHDQVVTFLLAGMETTAALLSWAWQLLAGHPPVREELHAEVDRVLSGRAAHYEDLPALETTGRVVTETLRLYPPGWLFTRATTRATRLGDHRLPAGATVVYSPYLIHRRADLFPDPETFDPARWKEGRKHAPGSFIPFGGGARRCIGDQFGTIEATLVLATIAATWRLDLPAGSPVRPARSASLMPRPFHARLTLR